MLAGSLVHNKINRILESIRRNWTLDQNKAEKEVVEEFKKAWRDSKSKKWETSPKWHTNLFEHYYKVSLPNEKLLSIKDLLVESIQGFYASDSFAFIQTLSLNEWLSKEELDSFEIDGTKVWVKLDFSARHGDRIYVYDWKTGKEVKENETQLAVYTLYAINKWKVDMKYVRLFDVYLRQQVPVKIKPTPVLLKNAEKLITKSIKDMKSLLDDVDENKASIDNFPKVDKSVNEWPCSYCNFKEMCY